MVGWRGESANKLMEIRAIYDVFLRRDQPNWHEYGQKLLSWALGDGPEVVQTFARSLICKLSERGEEADLELIEKLLDGLVSDLGVPVTWGRLRRLQAYFRYATTVFAGFVGMRNAQGMEIILRSWHDALGKISGHGGLQALMRIALPWISRLIFIKEADRLIQRRDSLEGEVGPTVDYHSAQAFFKFPSARKEAMVFFLDFCELRHDCYDEFEALADNIVGQDEPFAYNFGTGALYAQSALHFDRGYFLLRRFFDSENPVAKYEALRAFLYIFEYWPAFPAPVELVEEATCWVQELLSLRRRFGEQHKLRLDYSYPISQLCLILSKQTPGSTRRAMIFINGWLSEFGATATPDEKIFIIRGLKQYQQMLRRFSREATLQILRLTEEEASEQRDTAVRAVALSAIRELLARFPEQCDAFLADLSFGLEGRSPLIATIEEIRAQGEAGLPQQAGWSVNLTTFFQHILICGGGLRTELLNLLRQMKREHSLASYLVFLGQWLLDRKSMERLIAATDTITDEPQIAPDPSQLAPVLEHLDKKHQRHGQQNA